MTLPSDAIAVPFGHLKARRPVISPTMLIAAVAVFLLVFYNNTLIQKGIILFSGHLWQFAVLLVALFFLEVAVLSIFSSRFIVKPAMALMLILASVTSYYMDNLGVIFDRDMIQNVMTTTFNESKHLVTFNFVVTVVIWGILPSIVVFWVRLRPIRFWKATLINIAVFCLSFALTVGLLLTSYKSYASIFREHKEFMGSHQPGAALSGTIRYAKRMLEAKNVVAMPVGRDAIKGPDMAGAVKPVLTLIVVGETARAVNFSLNGYDRDTNRYLAQKDIVNFTDVSSCGTATAVSLPCMFSKFDRGTYSYAKGIGHENLLDVLSHAGVKVEWWDNNTGHKKVADRILFHSLAQSKDPDLCASGECVDGIFLDQLKGFAETITEDTVLVLHLIGSHGPTYYLRYPKAFEAFKPACRTAEFKNCTAQEITNSYDNTLLYTDFVLSQMMDTLKGQQGLLTSLVYISDHGESLGENGLYLHGAPYFMAPETQTKVPMVLWMSPSYRKQFRIDQSCLEGISNDTISHANLFHSVLGLLDVRVGVRDDKLDLFSACKSARAS